MFAVGVFCLRCFARSADRLTWMLEYFSVVCHNPPSCSVSFAGGRKLEFSCQKSVRDFSNAVGDKGSKKDNEQK